jgi:hypothetical protein
MFSNGWEVIMRTYIGVAILAAGLAGGGAAQAQSWGMPYAAAPAYPRAVPADWPQWQAQRYADGVCSGQRAAQLEQRLQREAGEGDIDPETAGRIHDAIDKLEQKASHECEENDWHGVTKVAGRYDRIEGWLDNAAGRGRWRSGW